MKSNKLMLAIGMTSVLLNAAEPKKGPMDAGWFYGENPYKQANVLHEKLEWKSAEEQYKNLLKQKLGDEYDRANAKVNKAACSWAQDKPSTGWKHFDTLFGIDKEQQISKEKIENAKKEDKKSILVYTADVGIGDISHFLKAAHELKDRTGWDVTVSMPNFLIDTFSGATTAYGLNVVGAKDPQQPKTDYKTHLISLLGHLKMHPYSVEPEKPLLTAPERAIKAVNDQISPLLKQGKTIGVVFAGDDRVATLIGGKKLVRRHLDSKPFMELLKKHPELVLIDCNNKASMLTVDEDKKNRYMPLVPEEKPFDTILGLAAAINADQSNSIIVLGADNGPPNVLVRALTKEAQRRMALIIPDQCDMRTEGQGDSYTQSISNVRVYKCGTPENQTAVIERAYQDMLPPESPIGHTYIQ